AVPGRTGMGLPAAVRDRVAAVHRGSALPERLRLYDGWAARYEQVRGTPRERERRGPWVAPLTAVSPQDVAALEYRAPHLAAASLAFAFPAPRAEARLLDVACGTGLVARELHRRGFRCLHGVDGSAGMLERARSTGLYQELRLCVLGRDPLPAPAGNGRGRAPGTPGGHPRGHPVSLLPVSCFAGGFLCLTTRSNPSNLRYKAELEAALGQLEQRGAWQKLLAQEVEYWERATTEEESTQGTGYISGVVYIYQKCPVPHLEEG
ncbi:MET27 protein, partial [Prunella fulvescens]|nr:MET27 protein [Prunella fulvescens]